MKKKGNVCEFTEARDTDLFSCFRRRLGEVKVIDLEALFAEVAMMPARRFYVSEFRAALVVKHHLRSGEWSVKGERRREMFAEIERRVLALQAADAGIDYEEAVYKAVNSPAPHFYLTPRSCRTLIYRYSGGGRK